MKKLLAILAATGMVASSSITVVACSENIDQDGLLDKNPASEKEILNILTNAEKLQTRINATSENLQQGELKEILAKLGEEELSTEEQNQLQASAEWNSYGVDSVVLIAIKIKTCQYVNSLDVVEVSVFMDANQDLLEKYGTIGAWMLAAQELKFDKEGIYANLESTFDTKLFSSETINTMKKVLVWIKNNNFATS